MTTFQEKYRAKIDQYSKAFRIEDLNDANDRSTLDIMLKTEIMIDDLQYQIQILMEDGVVDQATDIKKLADLLRDATNTITTLQKTLAIDRRTRKTEETASVADYIRALKRDARDFMEQRVVKVYCPSCKVLAGRIYPVHEHTSFSASFQCSQCKKLIRARREERDIFFDVKDADWRRKYRAEVVQPKKNNGVQDWDSSDELALGNSELVTEDTVITEERYVVDDDLEIGEEG